MAKLRLNGNVETYRKMISDGEAQVHVFGSGFAITEVREYTHPQERILNVLLLGGKQFDSWKEAADKKLSNFARVNGCTAIEFACRLGLEPKIALLGYRRKRVLMRKELDGLQATA